MADTGISVAETIRRGLGTPFSFEVLPPLRGQGAGELFGTVELLRPFEPRYVNVTAHRREWVYRQRADGLAERAMVRRRPGGMAVAAAVEKRYGLRVVPHLVCAGSTAEELEYRLIDMQYLGLSDILVLRGDKAPGERAFAPEPGGPASAAELMAQVADFNQGRLRGGERMAQPPETPFSCGVACYPERHEEAPNDQADMQALARKVELGAEYAVTQMFFAPARYFDFVRRAREAGIGVPIVPGVKPLTRLAQLSTLPRTFRCELPEELCAEARRLRDDERVRRLGVEWALAQCRELLRGGAPGIHFYTMGAARSVRDVAERLY